jgi:phosphoribosylformimino-5-aminoimidazole carboxamide ribotide isomerase
VGFRGGVAAALLPTVLAARFVADGADELHLVDLDAAETGEPRNADLLERIASESAVPARLAGGIASLHSARDAIRRGFAGVLFSSAVFADPALLRSLATLGDRAIVEIESRDGGLAPRGGDAGLVQRARGKDALTAAREAKAAGIRALYVIDVSADGALSGPPLALLQRVREAVPGVALHTGGGIRGVADLVALARSGIASAVVGRALADGRFTIAEARAACA